MRHDHHPRRPSRLPWSECVILKSLLWYVFFLPPISFLLLPLCSIWCWIPFSPHHNPVIRTSLKYTDDTTSRDSDSLIQEYGNLSGTGDTYTYCWRHPKVRENWRTVLAAVTLLVIGTGLIAMGAYAIAEPHNGSQAAVFFVAGFICFVPGAYHVVYIWLAARGYRGFDFYHLPLFT